jgi:hypothetical protein
MVKVSTGPEPEGMGGSEGEILFSGTNRHDYRLSP